MFIQILLWWQGNYLRGSIQTETNFGLRVGPAGQLPGTIRGRCDVPDIAGNTMPINSGFQKRKNFAENYPWARALKKYFPPRPKKFKEYRF